MVVLPCYVGSTEPQGARLTAQNNEGRCCSVTYIYMIARPAINTEGNVSGGPAWGLNQQLARLGKNQGGGSSAAGEQNQDRGERSKIRVSVTGPALAHKIEEVRAQREKYAAFFRLVRLNACLAGGYA